MFSRCEASWSTAADSNRILNRARVNAIKEIVARDGTAAGRDAACRWARPLAIFATTGESIRTLS
jgi:hypothetical protein